MRTNKKICILTSVHTPYDVRIFQKEAKSLQAAGYDVVLVAPCEYEDEKFGIKITCIRKFRYRLLRILFSPFLILIKALKEGANVYHFHDPELIPVGLILKLLGERVIFDVHEDIPKQILSKEYLPSFIRKPISFLYNFLERFSVNIFDYTIAAWEAIANRYPGKRIITVNNYPLLKVYKHAPQEKKITEDRTIVIYAGGLTPIRGIYEIIKAMEFTNPGIELWLLGEFIPPEFYEKVKTLKGFQKTKYFGKVPFEKVPLYYTKADIGIVCFLPEPNHINAIPNKLFEYMAAGLAVIASNFPLWQKIVKEIGSGICVDPLNPKEIAQAINYLHHKKSLVYRMGTKGQKAVLSKYNWEKEKHKLLELYNEILHKA